MNPIFKENKIELHDAYYEGSGSGWGDELRNRRYSVNPDHPEVKEILKRLEIEQKELQKQRETPKKYSPKKISSKK